MSNLKATGSLPKIIAVVGPTATGKSDLAVYLAKHFNGEVISADSRQVYRGLNIGSGKITKTEMQGVRHHLLDVADPKRFFSVDRYKELGTKAVTDILSRGKVPIICGGTGFYIDSLINNTDFPKVPPNKKLRTALSKKSTASLFSMLKKLDTKRAATIDAQNPVRLIRAIEIAKVLGHVPLQNTQRASYNVLHIGLTLPTETLKEKITTRLLERFNKGMLREAKRLHTQGLSFRRMEALGLEYRYEARYLQGNISKERMIDELERAIYHYAKRQITWFKRNKKIQWFEPRDRIRVEKIVKTFL